MTQRERARAQGFPYGFIIHISDAQAYRQFGNSVEIPTIQATAKNVIEKIIENNNNANQELKCNSFIIFLTKTIQLSSYCTCCGI